MKVTSILIHAWTLHKKDGQYYIPFTHWVYLNEIVKYYDKICLLSPTDLHLKDETIYESISCFPNVEVYELPYTDGYIAAVKNFLHYNKAYKELSSRYDVVTQDIQSHLVGYKNSIFKGKDVSFIL
ncbi:hypothetical protein OKW96_04490 [Sphingobacterium sp. KU25419]|nr:hypothetical protein OKW96_04490 [Sphingobacterium sp. KU25419]